jgi:hypothetical protein
MSGTSRLRDEARDLLELVLVPGLAALLPWRLCFRLFRWLSGYDFLYRESVHEALAQARQRGWVRGDESEWRRRRRLVTLIDHADFYLARTRSDRWMARHLSVAGEWPDPSQAAILCTFHWGAGMWGLRHAASRGMRASAVVAAHTRAAFAGRSVRFHYYGARLRAVASALGRPPIEVSPSPRRILRALRGGEQVVAAVDVPSDQVAASETIDFIGLRARVPRGLLRIAVDSRIAVTVFVTGIRMSDGRRNLQIDSIGVCDDVAALMAAVFARLEGAMEQDPAAWHFWEVAPRFFEASPSPIGT